MMKDFSSPKKSPFARSMSPKSPNRVKKLKMEIKEAKNNINILKEEISSKKKAIQSKENKLVNDASYFSLSSKEKAEYLQSLVPTILKNSKLQEEIKLIKSDILNITQKTTTKTCITESIYDSIKNSFNKSYINTIQEEIQKGSQKIMQHEDFTSQISPFLAQLEIEHQTLTSNAMELQILLDRIQEKYNKCNEVLSTPIPSLNALEILIETLENSNLLYSSIKFEDIKENRYDYVGEIEASNCARREYLQSQEKLLEPKVQSITLLDDQVSGMSLLEFPELHIQNELNEYLKNAMTHYYDYEMETDLLYQQFTQEKKQKSIDFTSKLDKIAALKREIEEIDKINEEIEKHQDLIIDEKDNLLEINKYSNDIKKRPINEVPMFSPKSPRSNRRMDIKRRKLRRNEEIIQNKKADIERIKFDITKLEKESLSIQERLQSYNADLVKD